MGTILICLFHVILLIILHKIDTLSTTACIKYLKIHSDFVDIYTELKPFRKLQCPKPSELELCQTHYQVLWSALTNSFQNYTIVREDEVREGFTYTFHTSISHLHRIHNVIRNWQGPITISLFADWSEIPKLQRLLGGLKGKLVNVVLYITSIESNKMDNCVFHNINGSILCTPQDELIYPINYLRNLAINSVTTRFWLNMDADIIPSKGLYDYLLNLNLSKHYMRKSILILPVFQFTLDYRKRCLNDICFEHMVKEIPDSMDGLKQCMHEGHCQICNAHLTTRRVISHSWWNTSKPIIDYTCLPNKYMEPYMILQKLPNMPLYDDHFVNYGFNNVQYFVDLRYHNYTFHVISGVFGFDTPHKESKLAERFNVYRMDENKQARERFLDRISQMPDLGVFNVCTKEYADEHFPRYFVL